jgi:hypothetical protein
MQSRSSAKRAKTLEDVAHRKTEQDDTYAVGGVKKPRGRISSSRHTLKPSTFQTAIDDLKENGYCWLKEVVPPELCETCAHVIQDDVGGRLDEGSRHQEEPIERLNASTGKIMLKVRDFILKNVLRQKVRIAEKSTIKN